MKNLIQLILQLVGFFMVLAFIFSLLNYFFNWHLGMKGSEVPGDPRSAVLFLVIGVVCGGIVFLMGRKKQPVIQNNPD